MLYISLVPAFAVLLAAKYAATPAPERVRWGLFVPVGLGAFCLPVVMLMVFPVIVWLAGLLLLALAAWPLIRRRVSNFWPVGITAALVAYGIASWSAYRDLREENRLREAYPLVSMAARVPEPRPEPIADERALAWLSTHEDPLAGGFGWRESQLRRLHTRTTDAFVNSDGFGVARMPGRITEHELKPPERPEVPPQPGSPALWPHGEAFELSPAPAREQFAKMHRHGLGDFAFREGWGYRQDRDRVAGFLSHRFSKVPTTETWTVHRIELVGLLKHAAPKVYLSDKLPAMDDLRGAPTRPLDAFETAGLVAIRKGEEGFAAQRPDVVRYLGAIRSAKQCVECHGGQRGDLLGAFAYTLRR